MKKIYILALLVTLSAPLVAAVEAKKENSPVEKKEEQKLSKYFTNYKGIATGSVAIILAINASFRLQEMKDKLLSKDPNPKKNREAFTLFCNALLNAYVSWQAYNCSAKTWRQIR